MDYSPAGQRLPDTLLPVSSLDLPVLSMPDGMGDFLVAGSQALATPGQIAAAAEHINNVMAVLPEKTLIELFPGARDAIDSAIDQTPKGEPVRMPALRQMIRMRYSSILITLVAFMLTFLATTSDVAAQDEGDPLAGLTEGQKEWILEQMCNTAGPVGQLCADLVEQVRAAEDADSATVTGYASASADDEATVVSSYPNGAGNDADGEKPTLEPTPEDNDDEQQEQVVEQSIDLGTTRTIDGGKASSTSIEYNKVFEITGQVGRYVFTTQTIPGDDVATFGIYRVNPDNTLTLVNINNGEEIGSGVEVEFQFGTTMAESSVIINVTPLGELPNPQNEAQYPDIGSVLEGQVLLTNTIYSYRGRNYIFQISNNSVVTLVWATDSNSWQTYDNYIREHSDSVSTLLGENLGFPRLTGGYITF